MTNQIERLLEKINSEIIWEWTLSRGSGGQHLQKNKTAALLRWNVNYSRVLNNDEKALLLQKLRLTNDGELLIRSERFRETTMNKKDALRKLEGILAAALKKEKKRVPTKISRSKKAARVDTKKRHGQVKAGRSRVKFDD